MIEITHAPDERKERTRRIPKNIRQIGNVGGYGKIYMEDMVYQFLQEGGIEEGQNLVTYLLLGEDFYQNEEQYLFIRGAMELEGIAYRRDFPVFTEEIWNQIAGTMRRHFHEEKILGWAVNRKGSRLDYCSDMENICRRHFHGENQMVLFFDTVDHDEMIYLCHDGRFVKKEGYHIYYEKNTALAEYLTDYHDRKENLAAKRQQEQRRMEQRMLEESSASWSWRAEQESKPAVVRTQDDVGNDTRNDTHNDARSQAGRELEKRFYQEAGSGDTAGREPDRAGRGQDTAGWEQDTVSRYRDLLREKERAPVGSWRKAGVSVAVLLLVILAAFALGNYVQLADMEDAVDALAKQQAQEEVMETISQKAGELTDATDTTQEDGQTAPENTADGVTGNDSAQNTGENTGENPGGNTGTNTADQPAEQPVAAETNPYLAQGYYIVQQGDKLLDISRKVYGTEDMVAAICEANKITDINHIQVGDKLTLPPR